MAWALIAMLDGAEDPQVSPSERVRLSKRVQQLRQSDDPANLLRSWAGRRAERVKYAAAVPDLVELRADSRLQLSGLSAPDGGVVARGVVEAYVAAVDAALLIDDYFLVQPDDHRGNVIFHVVDHEAAGVPPRVDICWPLVAIDLAEHSGFRAQARAAELVREELGS